MNIRYSFRVMLLLFFAIACSRDQHSTPEVQKSRAIPDDDVQSWSTLSHEVVSKTTLLASITNIAYNDPDSKRQSIPPKIVFSDGGQGVAYLAYRDGKYQVVHNGKPGKSYSSINHVSLSPDGSRVAHDSAVNGKKCIVLDGVEGTLYDDVWEPVFSPDGRHIAYIAQKGDTSFIVVDGRISSRVGPPNFNGNPIFSADSSKFAYVCDSRLTVSDLEMKQRVVVPCGDNDEPLVNRDKTLIAVVKPTSNGHQLVVVSLEKLRIISEGSPYDAIEKPAFGNGGASIVYVAAKGNKRYVVSNDTEEVLPEAKETGTPSAFGQKEGIGLFLLTKSGVVLYQAFEHRGFIGDSFDEAAQLVYDRTGRHYAHVARKGKKLFVVVNGKKSPSFDMVIDPQFTPDGRKVVFRARKSGKRFVVVVDTKGALIRQYPKYELVYEMSFVRDGRSIAYGVKDGDQLIWKVEAL